jgi:SagB-type dehydrogenase family enzyme
MHHKKYSGFHPHNYYYILMHAQFRMLIPCLIVLLAGCSVAPTPPLISTDNTIVLTPPVLESAVSLEETLANRRSIRGYTGEPLTLSELSQLLWATQGITHPQGMRTAPSAGALYPLELYVALPSGFYHYVPRSHTLEKHKDGDLRLALNDNPTEQAVFVVAAVFQRTAQRYGDRAQRYVHMEVGHAAQNLLLQAVAMDLGAFPIGAFHDRYVQEMLSLPEDHEPLYLIPVGRI